MSMKLNKKIYSLIAPVIKAVAKEVREGSCLSRISVTEDSDYSSGLPCVDIFVTFNRNRKKRYLAIRMLEKDIL